MLAAAGPPRGIRASPPPAAVQTLAELPRVNRAGSDIAVAQRVFDVNPGVAPRGPPRGDRAGPPPAAAPQGAVQRMLSEPAPPRDGSHRCQAAARAPRRPTARRGDPRCCPGDACRTSPRRPAPGARSRSRSSPAAARRTRQLWSNRRLDDGLAAACEPHQLKASPQSAGDARVAVQAMLSETRPRARYRSGVPRARQPTAPG